MLRTDTAAPGLIEMPALLGGDFKAMTDSPVSTQLLQQWCTAAVQIKSVEEQLSALRTSLICAFNQLLDLKDLNTGVHSTRLAEWALHVAGELGLDERAFSDIEVAALLHDIGKIGIPDAILHKPAKLTDAE